jgi:peptide/nickel transport system substrate-binding protein
VTTPLLSRLTVAQQGEPRSLNPALENGGLSAELGLLLFQYLVKFDDHGRLVADAAMEVPTIANGGIARDGSTIRYRLRANLRFADGRRLTARDCVYSVAAILDPTHNVQSRYGYDVITKAEAPDDRTLVLHLKHPFAPLITIVMAPQGFPILPEHLLRKSGDFNRGDFTRAPVGSGPYVVTRWLHGDRLEMRANPYYAGGKPNIEHLEIRFVADPNAAINLLRTGEVAGWINDLDYAGLPQLRSIKGLRIRSTPVDIVGAIIFNTKDPLTADRRVRRALATAIDVKPLVGKAYRGAMSVRGAGRGLFIGAYDPAAYPDVPYDPGHARALLDAAGWIPAADGVRRKKGKRLDLSFIIQAGTPGDAIIANSVAQYERAVGANVVVKQFTISTFGAPAAEGGPVYGGHFHMALYPFGNGDDPDTTDQFACANVPPKGYNKSRICLAAIDALLAQGRGENDPAKRKVTYAQLQALLYREMPIMLLYQAPEIDAFPVGLNGGTGSISTAWWNAGAWTM